MAANNVTEDELKEAVSRKGYFPVDTKISAYPEDFVMGCLVGAFPQVFELIKKIRDEKDNIPF